MTPWGLGLSRSQGRKFLASCSAVMLVGSWAVGPAPAGAQSEHPSARTAATMTWSTPVLADPSRAVVQTIIGVSCPSSGLCVAWDGNGNVFTSKDPTDGATWALTNVDHTTGISDISCPSTTLCVAVDPNGNVFTSTGPTGGVTAWRGTKVGSADINAISCPSAHLCVADGDGHAIISTDPTGGPSAWATSKVQGNTISCPSADLCAATDWGDVITSNAPTATPPVWTTVAVDHDYDHTYGLGAISCPSVRLCAAADDYGNIITSTDPTGDASSWTTTDVAGTSGVDAISCPSAQLCAAAGQNGNVLTSTAPFGGTPAWTATKVDGAAGLVTISCPSAHLCVAVDQNGKVVTSTDPTGGASSWRASTVNELVGASLRDISCPTVGLCVAVDNSGNVVTTTHPTGTASSWKVSQVDDNGLMGISCPSATLCTSSDSYYDIVTSTNPTVGASSWVTTSLGYGGTACESGEILTLYCPVLTGAKCTSVVLCFAFGTDGNNNDFIFSSTEPTRGEAAWSGTEVDNTNLLDAIACPSKSACVAVDDAGNVVTTAHPTGGRTGWTVRRVDGSRRLAGISCPAPALCVAVDNAGNVVTSTHPLGPASSWTVRHVDGSHQLDGISCPSTTLCVAVDNAGDVVTSVHPAGGASAWTVRRVDGSRPLQGISCPETTLCVAVDGSGYAIHGTALPVASAATISPPVVDASRSHGTLAPPAGARGYETLGSAPSSLRKAVESDVSFHPVWPQQAELTASDGGSGAWFGYPVSISGTTALIGAWGPPTAISVVSSVDSAGAAYVFTESGAAWAQRAELTASDGGSGDLFGYSVSLSGTTALIGAPGRGVAYVFSGSGGKWSQRAELAPFDATPGYDYFGYSVSISGTAALIGAPGDNSDQGVAYVFSGSGGKWSRQAKLTAADGAPGDGFGDSVSLAGATAVVGAPNDCSLSDEFFASVCTNTSQGAAYVFGAPGGTWSKEAELRGPGGPANDQFGFSVSLSGTTAVVGAPGYDNSQGAAFVFGAPGGRWSTRPELAAPGTEANEQYGFSVSISGTTAVVGAPGYNNSQGIAYVFGGAAGPWTAEGELTSTDYNTGDAFGDSVSISGTIALIGAPEHYYYAGAAYIFRS